tara:strand:- start:244 stop:492 length:249 start_codon:yes stop_codon:yes gene_type:complete
MLLEIPQEVTYNIFEYLLNEEIFEICIVNKEINNMIKTQEFREYLNYRNHPIVFNKIDHICDICNLKLIILDLSFDVVICKH